MYNKKILLDLISQHLISNPNSRVALNYSGSVNDSFVLKLLLQDTESSVSVFLLSNDPNYQENLNILQKYQKYRPFDIREVVVQEDVDDYLCNDPILHVQMLPEIDEDLEYVDIYINTKSKEYFSNPLTILTIFDQLTYHDLPIQYLTPFYEVSQKEISSFALSGFLLSTDINYSAIYRNNVDAIEYLKSLKDIKYFRKSDFEKGIFLSTDFDALFLYLMSNVNIDRLHKFIENYGDYISKEVSIYSLSYCFPFNPIREKIITALVAVKGLSDEDLNKILINIVNSFAGNKKLTNDKRVSEVDYFFRLYSVKISEKTKDQIIWKSYAWINWYNEPLLQKLVDLGCDVGELLIRVIDDFKKDTKESSAIILLDKYLDKIHKLQLNEALIKAESLNLHNLCYKLIEVGADKKILQVHRSCYARILWNKTKSKDIKIGRSYWRRKDKIIIHEILKELGNPEKKVPNIIHVTGSNGKGSTCAFLRSILESNGNKVHVLTSPAIIRENENYIVSGKEILDEDYYKYLKLSEEAFLKIKNRKSFKDKINEANKLDNLQLKTIEADGYLDWSFIVPAIILAFSENKADATIIEVITGGELDMTNVFDEKNTIATIINNIILGDNHASLEGFKTIEGVANTKSKLSKRGVPVISAQQEDAVSRVIDKNTKDLKCPLHILGKGFEVKDDSEKYFIFKGFDQELKLLKPKLAGDFQVNNVALALSAILINRDKFKIDLRKISKAISGTKNLGRFSEINNNISKNHDKLMHGSLKTSCGVLNFMDSVKKKNQLMDLIFMSTTDDSFAYSMSYLESDLISHFRNKIYLMNNVNQKPSNVNTELMARMVSKISDLTIKRYLSSAIAKISNLDVKNYDDKADLSIFSTGINSFNDIYLNLLGIVKQDNFKKDLEFARKKELINPKKLLLLDGVDKNSIQEFKALSSGDGVASFYDKRFFKDAYNLEDVTDDEFLSINSMLQNVSSKKKKIKVVDFGCGDGRLFGIFHNFLKENPNTAIDLIACDVSKRGLENYENKLTNNGFIKKAKSNEDAEGSVKLASSSINMEVNLVSFNNGDYKALESIVSNSDMLLSVSVLSHILGSKNRNLFYEFADKNFNNVLIATTRVSFEPTMNHFNNLRKRKREIERMKKIEGDVKIELDKINLQLKDAQEDNEFYYKAEWVRGYSELCPEDKGYEVPFVNFPDAKKFANLFINEKFFKRGFYYYANALAGHQYNFVIASRDNNIISSTGTVLQKNYEINYTS